MTAVIVTKRPNYATGKMIIQRHLNLRLVNAFLASLVLLVGAYYLVSVNDLTVKGFVLQSLKTQANMLSSDNQDSETKIVNLQSYGNLSAKVQKLNMVAVGGVDYLTVNSSLLAKN
jgi:hypothetical protein